MKHLFEKIDICDEALSVAEILIKDRQENEAASLLTDISLLVESIKKSLENDLSGHVFVEKAIVNCLNILHSLKCFLEYPEKRYRIFFYEIKVSFWQLKTYVDWKYKYLSTPENLQNYRKMVADSCHDKLNRKEKKTYKYKVSIILTAYNKLPYTKLAIESIYKYTDFSSSNIELITVNNGSTDGTEEYFDSLPNEKKANFKHNLLGAPIAPFLCEGEFIVGFSTDAVATPHWLEQLITCMESSPDIAIAVPTCNEDSVELWQGIPIPYQNDISSIGAIEKFAHTYNHSDPSLWEDRIAVMPFVSISRNELWCDLPFVDPAYTKIQFVDDDFSTLFRRTGWRMVLAKDTFLHHFGHITLGDNKIASNDNALSEMRKVYFDKWGVDAWESRGILHIKWTFQGLVPKKQSHILWIEPKFGMDFLLTKNFYRQEHCEDITADAIVLDSRYLPDAEPYFERVITTENLPQTLLELHKEYDLIGMSAYLHEILDGSAIDMLEQLYGLLKPEGQLLVPIKNFNSASNLEQLIMSGGMSPWGSPANTFKGLSLGEVMKKLSQHELSKVCSRFIIVDSNQKLYEEMFSRLFDMFSDVYNSNEFELIMKISMMWLKFQKKT